MNRISLGIAFVAIALFPTGSYADTWTKTVINNDHSGFPFGNLISDKIGNLYGTDTSAAGCAGPACGSVFKLMPPKTGQTTWTKTLLYSSPGDGTPRSLLMDTAGNLYGVAPASGQSAGMVFKLTAPAAGQTTWTRTVLHSFGSLHYGPVGGLTMDTTGNLYGVVQTTFEGDGEVYKLSPPTAGKTAWTLTTLTSLVTYQTNGEAAVIFDKTGNLYGTDADTDSSHPKTCPGSDCGSVFKLTPPAGGKGAWKKTVLHRFAGGKDGALPQGGLLIGAAGIVYGATAKGGTTSGCATYAGCGTIFKLAPPAPGKSTWSETVLYRFNPINRNGPTPVGGLAFDRAGNLYGVTQSFDATKGRGTVYRLTRPSTGTSAWGFSILSQFYGTSPQDGLLIGAKGAVFGAAGPVNFNSGFVYQLTPPSP